MSSTSSNEEDKNHATKKKKKVSTKALVTTSILVLFVTITTYAGIVLWSMPGRIDALLLRAPGCHHGQGMEQQNQTNTNVTEEQTNLTLNEPEFGSCRNKEEEHNRLQDETLLNRFIWRRLEDAIASSPDDDEDNPMANETACSLCSKYKDARSHIRMEKLLLTPTWWYQCTIRIRNMAVHSEPGIICSRAHHDEEKNSTDEDSTRNNNTNTTYSSPPLSWWDKFSSRNVLLVHVDDSEHSEWCLPRKNVEDDTEESIILPLPPPPAVEIRDLELKWRSWIRPVLDYRISGLRLNVVLANGGDGGGGEKNGNGNSLFNLPIPSVLLGNFTMDEIVSALPTPPEEEGAYPRFGVLNITNVTVTLHRSLDNTDEKFEQLTVSHFDVPDKLFRPLLEASIEAGPEGIDQRNIDSVVQQNLGKAVRGHLLGEEKIGEGLNKTMEMVDLIKTSVMGKMQESGDAIDGYFSNTVTNIKDAWENLEGEFKSRMNGGKEEKNPLVGAMDGVKGSLDNLQNPLTQYNSMEGGALTINEWVQQSWDVMKKQASGEGGTDKKNWWGGNSNKQTTLFVDKIWNGILNERAKLETIDRLGKEK